MRYGERGLSRVSKGRTVERGCKILRRRREREERPEIAHF